MRVAILAGSLTWGGAEKQLAYHVRALSNAGVRVLLMSLDGSQYYGDRLVPLVDQFVSIEPMAPPRRLARIASLCRRFRPDIVQATHTFANLYAHAASRACGATSIGALRGVLVMSERANGPFFHRWHLAAPDAILSNSYRAAGELAAALPRRRNVHVLENALDLEALDRESKPRQDLRRAVGAGDGEIVVVGVGTVRGDKRFDRFLRVLALARERLPALKGVIVGDGPDTARVLAQQQASPLLREGLVMYGREQEAARLLSGADIFLLTSDNEGFPNALLEGMAARLPSVVTPAGDAGRAVERSASGFVHDFEDERGMAASLVTLGGSLDRRRDMGARARGYVEAHLDVRDLWPRMRMRYSEIARDARRPALLARVDAIGPADGARTTRCSC